MASVRWKFLGTAGPQGGEAKGEGRRELSFRRAFAPSRTEARENHHCVTWARAVAEPAAHRRSFLCAAMASPVSAAYATEGLWPRLETLARRTDQGRVLTQLGYTPLLPPAPPPPPGSPLPLPPSSAYSRMLFFFFCHQGELSIDLLFIPLTTKRAKR